MDPKTVARTEMQRAAGLTGLSIQLVTVLLGNVRKLFLK
jgi:hypothetical protein